MIHPQFDPVVLHLGPLAVRWYGLMYLVGFALVWMAGRYRIARTPGGVWTARDFDDVLFFGILGTIDQFVGVPGVQVVFEAAPQRIRVAVVSAQEVVNLPP